MLRPMFRNARTADAHRENVLLSGVAQRVCVSSRPICALSTESSTLGSFCHAEGFSVSTLPSRLSNGRQDA
jgi:hypothetical protein